MTVIYEFALKQTLTRGNRQQRSENRISLTSYFVGLTHLESHWYVCHLCLSLCVCVCLANQEEVEQEGEK